MTKSFIREECAYKRIGYFSKCYSCNGKDHNEMCYTTREQLDMHMEDFRRLFDRSNTDDEFQEVVDILKGEMFIW